MKITNLTSQHLYSFYEKSVQPNLKWLLPTIALAGAAVCVCYIYWPWSVQPPKEVPKIDVEKLTIEELARLTFKQILDLPPEQLTKLHERQSEVKKEAISGRGRNPMETPFSQLHAIPCALLSKHVGGKSVEILKLFTSEQLDGLDFGVLSEDQFKVVFADENRIKSLQGEKLDNCIHRLAQWMPDSLDLLTDEQLRSLDFNDSGVSADALTTISKRQNGARIARLKRHQIYDAMSDNKFNEDSSRYITIRQAKYVLTIVAAGRIAPDNEKNAIRLLSMDENKIPCFQAQDMNYFIPHMITNHLCRLSKEQVRALDFKNRAVVTSDVLEGMIQSSGGEEDNKGHLIGFLTTIQIIDGITCKTLTAAAAKFVTVDQIAEMDFNPVKTLLKENSPLIKALLQRDEGFESGIIVSKIQVNSINLLTPYINENVLNCLTQEQMSVLDFSENGSIEKPIFGRMLMEKRNNDTVVLPAGHLVQFMTPEQLVQALNRSDFFGKRRLDDITNDQLRNLDLTQIAESESKTKLKKRKEALVSDQ